MRKRELSLYAIVGLRSAEFNEIGGYTHIGHLEVGRAFNVTYKTALSDNDKITFLELERVSIESEGAASLQTNGMSEIILATVGCDVADGIRDYYFFKSFHEKGFIIELFQLTDSLHYAKLINPDQIGVIQITEYFNKITD